MHEELRVKITGLQRDALQCQQSLNGLVSERETSLQMRQHQLFLLSSDVLQAVIALCQTVDGAIHAPSPHVPGAFGNEGAVKDFTDVSRGRIESTCETVQTSMERLENAFGELLVANDSISLRMSQCYNGMLLDLRNRIQEVSSAIDREQLDVNGETEKIVEVIRKLEAPLVNLNSKLATGETKRDARSKSAKKAGTAAWIQLGISSGCILISPLFPPAALLGVAGLAGSGVSGIASGSIKARANTHQNRINEVQTQIEAQQRTLLPVQEKSSMLTRTKQDLLQLEETSSNLVNQSTGMCDSSHQMQLQLNADKERVHLNTMAITELVRLIDLGESPSPQDVIRVTHKFGMNFIEAARQIQERSPIDQAKKNVTQNLLETLIHLLGKSTWKV